MEWGQNFDVLGGVGEHLVGQLPSPVGLLLFLVQLLAQLPPDHVLKLVGYLLLAHAASLDSSESLSSRIWDISIVSITSPPSPSSKPISKRKPRSKRALCITSVLFAKVSKSGRGSTSKQSKSQVFWAVASEISLTRSFRGLRPVVSRSRARICACLISATAESSCSWVVISGIGTGVSTVTRSPSITSITAFTFWAGTSYSGLATSSLAEAEGSGEPSEADPSSPRLSRLSKLPVTTYLPLPTLLRSPSLLIFQRSCLVAL